MPRITSNKELIQQTIREYAGKMPAAQMAETLGVNKGIVCSHAFRMGISLKVTIEHRPAKLDRVSQRDRNEDGEELFTDNHIKLMLPCAL